MRLVWVLSLIGIACTADVEPTDATDAPPSDETVSVRVVTWNVEGLGARASDEGLAERAILDRLDADIIGFNELDEVDARRLTELGQDLGYDIVYTASDNPFGSIRNGLITRLDVVSIEAPSASVLSGDANANDVTRWPVRATLQKAGARLPLQVVVNHWKSGFGPTDKFRRALDGVRTAQAITANSQVVMMGDVNAELEDMPETPRNWTTSPGGLPSGYRLGSDQVEVLKDGLLNDAFAPMIARGLVPVDAMQLDGRAQTRPISGRRIDWVFVSADLVERAQGEIYDSTDEGKGPGLPKFGEPPERGASQAASDHLPIVVDLQLPAT